MRNATSKGETIAGPQGIDSSSADADYRLVRKKNYELIQDKQAAMMLNLDGRHYHGKIVRVRGEKGISRS